MKNDLCSLVRGDKAADDQADVAVGFSYVFFPLFCLLFLFFKSCISLPFALGDHPVTGELVRV